MTPEEWQKIKGVLQTALELPPGARGDFLDSACTAQCSVRAEVESLLRSHEEDKAFLEHPVDIDTASLLDNTSPATWVGRRLGPYEVLEQIGEGGMGAVFRAVRADGMYDKQVAVKLIRSGLSTDFFVSRFEVAAHLHVRWKKCTGTKIFSDIFHFYGLCQTHGTKRKPARSFPFRSLVFLRI
jgi:serine/threonine protein kinase